MKGKTLRYLRWGILAAILAYITGTAFLHQQGGREKAASVHALCPYGGLESLYSLIFSGSFVQKIFTGTMVILLLSVVITLLFRRSFCGVLCPFGALQEFLGKLGQKILGRRLIMPATIDRPLRYLKYAVLILTLTAAWVTGGLWMDPYDPYSTYAHLFAGISSSVEERPVGFILLLITVVGSFLYDRFFCKYLCPAGAFYSLLGKLSPTLIERNNTACIHCKLCSKNCPMNIDVEKETKITSSECINCLECVNVCPKKGAISVKLARKGISTATVALLVLGIFFGGIALAQATGNFQTKPAPVTPGSITGSEEIKGSMTLKDIAKGMNISIDELYAKLALPKNVPAETKLKDVSQYVEGFSPEEAREKLQKK
ncbi:MAG: hypothetical protein PWQ31_753 [Eubacteriales bacterium]|nr:hypothetical protein [Eubacteriales bacterium]